MNLFIVLGLLCLFGSEFYQPWREYWRKMRSIPVEIYRAHRQGTAPRRPMWFYTLIVLGWGFMVLGFWRLWSGL